jgi:hypothetical protein
MIMAIGGSMMTITLIGAILLIFIFTINLIFFLNQDKGFIDWLKYVTSKNRIITIFEVIFSVVYVLEFISIFILI